MGRLPAVFPVGLHDLTYYIVAGALPKAPASMPVPDFSDWGVLGNSQFGDCGPAALQHLMEAAATDTGKTETWPTDQQVIDYYLAYTGGQDDGVVLSQYLAYVRTRGYYGHTVAAFAPVRMHEVATLTSAIYLYDAAYCGINVTQAMMDAFGAGQPWTLAMAQGEPLGGHCIPLVAFSPEYLTAISWGGVQQIEYDAWHAMSEEAWAVIPGELAAGDGHGVNLAALEADLDRLGGHAPPPAPAPAPAPAPIVAPPGPAGTPTAPSGLLQDLAARARWVATATGQDYRGVVDWLRAHRP
jgi:hypothetical protein